MKRGNHFFKGFSVFFTAVLLAAFPVSVRAEEIPSAENTDGGSISLNIVHYQAQSLTLSLDSSHLAFQDVTLNCTDAATGEPLCISLLADPGTSDYTLYDLDVPAEEISGTLNISMITEPGYKLDLDQAVFHIGSETYSSGSTAVLHTPGASVNSSVTCSEMALPQTPAVPDTSDVPAEPEVPAQTEIPAEPETPAQTETPSVPETAADPETPAVSESSAVHAEPETRTSVNSAEQTSSQTAPEVLSTVPVAAEQSASVPQQISDTGNQATASASSAAETAETIRKTTGQTPEINTSVSSAEAAENSDVHVSDLTERVNLVLAVLVLIVLILLLTKLLLTLKREKKHNRYRRYRFR